MIIELTDLHLRFKKIERGRIYGNLLPYFAYIVELRAKSKVKDIPEM
jgi:hypothetical protein